MSAITQVSLIYSLPGSTNTVDPRPQTSPQRAPVANSYSTLSIASLNHRNQLTLMPDQPRRRRARKTLPDDAPEVASPCISICEIDQKTGLCSGCYRTLEEIATWSRMPNQKRWDIVQSLRDRRADFKKSAGDQN